MRTHQHELPVEVSGIFNLAPEMGEDPIRVMMDRQRLAEKAEAALEYERAMQRKFQECPGFVGADVPAAPGLSGKVIIEPAKAFDAMTWLKRRFHVNENLELSGDRGICIEVIPRDRKISRQGRRARIRFGGPEQYELGI